REYPASFFNCTVYLLIIGKFSFQITKPVRYTRIVLQIAYAQDKTAYDTVVNYIFQYRVFSGEFFHLLQYTRFQSVSQRYCRGNYGKLFSVAFVVKSNILAGHFAQQSYPVVFRKHPDKIRGDLVYGSEYFA